MVDLETLYRETLQACRPEELVEPAVTPEMPRNVVSIGKCAGGLLDGVVSALTIDDAFVALPHGYPPPKCRAEIARGGHPVPDDASFEAGRRLLEFVRRRDDMLFLISGGGSACVEAPLDPWFTAKDIVDVTRRIVAAGIPIEEMNVVRKHLSAIKGGRLAGAVRGRCVTLLYSDVSTGDETSIASGPTVADGSTKAEAIAILERVGGCDRIVTKLRDESVPETVRHLERATTAILADNSILVRTAARIATASGLRAKVIDAQIESDVDAAAALLARKAAKLQRDEVLIAGGEPTVVARGPGKGGRCLEVAVRFALKMKPGVIGLFGSSDGVDGNSGVAGALVDRSPADRGPLTAALEQSDSLSVIGLIGRPIIIPPTGNNLRDLYLLART